MSDNQYVLWFILMAVGVLVILGLGTAQMAGLFRREQQSDNADEAEVHHWYDRLHLHRHHHAA